MKNQGADPEPEPGDHRTKAKKKTKQVSIKAPAGFFTACIFMLEHSEGMSPVFWLHKLRVSLELLARYSAKDSFKTSASVIVKKKLDALLVDWHKKHPTKESQQNSEDIIPKLIAFVTRNRTSLYKIYTKLETSYKPVLKKLLRPLTPRNLSAEISSATLSTRSSCSASQTSSANPGPKPTPTKKLNKVYQYLLPDTDVQIFFIDLKKLLDKEISMFMRQKWCCFFPSIHAAKHAQMKADLANLSVFFTEKNPDESGKFLLQEVFEDYCTKIIGTGGRSEQCLRNFLITHGVLKLVAEAKIATLKL